MLRIGQRPRRSRATGTGAPPPPAARATMTVSRGRPLNTGYTDLEVVAMATEDGGKEFQTSIWGPENHTPRGLHLVYAATRTGMEATGAGLFAELPSVERSLEDQEAVLPRAEADACRTLDALERAEQVEIELSEQLRAEGLHEPEQGLRHAIVDWLPFVGFLVPETILLSTVFQLFGLSDESIVGPVNELFIAAFASALALSLLMHLGGVYVVRTVHRLGVGAARRGIAAARQANVLRWWNAGLGVLLAVSALVATIYMQDGLTRLRTSFFAASGVDAQPASFMALQLGILSAGLLWAIHRAHPYALEWRQVYATLRHRADDHARAATVLLGGMALQWGSIRDRILLLRRYVSIAEAQRLDGIRQGVLYVRALQHSLPESTSDRLFDDELGGPTRPAWCEQVEHHLQGMPEPGPGPLVAPVLKHYVPYEATRYRQRLEAILDRGDAHASARYGHFLTALDQFRTHVDSTTNVSGNGDGEAKP